MTFGDSNFSKKTQHTTFGDTNIKYHCTKDFNINFDEKGNTCGTLRLAQWLKPDQEPDDTKAKPELRKMYVTKEGERMGKGYTFSSIDAVHDLTQGLVTGGFGNTKNILRSISTRDDFLESVETFDQEENSDGEMFDMRDILKNIL